MVGGCKAVLVILVHGKVWEPPMQVALSGAQVALSGAQEALIKMPNGGPGI